MANGKITLGKQSGGTLGLVFPDGVSNTAEANGTNIKDIQWQ